VSRMLVIASMAGGVLALAACPSSVEKDRARLFGRIGPTPHALDVPAEEEEGDGGRPDTAFPLSGVLFGVAFTPASALAFPAQRPGERHVVISDTAATCDGVGETPRAGTQRIELDVPWSEGASSDVAATYGSFERSGWGITRPTSARAVVLRAPSDEDAVGLIAVRLTGRDGDQADGTVAVRVCARR
jgi:hypothetical protein